MGQFELLISRTCQCPLASRSFFAQDFLMKFFLLFLAFACIAQARPDDDSHGWISLFNGKDLQGWTPKIAGYPAGKNAFDTFRVEDGILKVCYDRYPHFGNHFGHLYSKTSYSHYRLQLEYRFIGRKLADAPDYVNLNSGVMYHSPPADSLTLDQAFPASLEFQFLADEGRGPRATGNLCTPGTHVEWNGTLTKEHIISSTSPTFGPDEWVKIELEVHGNQSIIHRVNGKEVLRFEHPVLDPDCPITSAQPLLNAGASKNLSAGHIALQAEGQAIWFRNIRIKPLPIPPAS